MAFHRGQLTRQRYPFELWIPLFIVAVGEAVVLSVMTAISPFVSGLSLVEYVQFQEPAMIHFNVLNLLWGGWRVYSTHPVFSKPYFDWLRRTPWQPGKNLPAGNVHLSLRDIAILTAVAAWFAWRGGWEAGCVALIAFLCGYATLLLACFYATQLYRQSYWLMIGANLLLWATLLPLGWLLLAFAVLVVGMQFSINSSLLSVLKIEKFPFYSNRPFDRLRFESIGWPHHSLAPRPILFDSPQSSIPDSLSYAALLLLLAATLANAVGLSCYLMFRQENTEFLDSWTNTVFHVGIAVAIGFFRTSIWLIRIRRPTSRINASRLIVWKFDRVFVAPLVGVAISFILATAALWINGAWVVTIPLTCGIAVLCNGFIGPHYHDFRMTHAGRIGWLLPPSSNEMTK